MPVLQFEGKTAGECYHHQFPITPWNSIPSSRCSEIK